MVFGSGMRRQIKVEQGIESMVKGLVMAVNYIGANGQAVTNFVNAPYWNVTAQPQTSYVPSDGSVIHPSNTEVYHDKQTVVVPEARSGLDPVAWSASAQKAMQLSAQDLERRVIEPRTTIVNALTWIADEAGLRTMGVQQAMQKVEQSVGALNAIGNMTTTFNPDKLYETLRLFTNLVELMRPQAAAGAQAQQEHQLLFADLQQRLTSNKSMRQMTQPVQYTLPAQQAAVVILAQYAMG